MAEKRVIDHDPLTGITTWHWYDETSDTTYIEDTWDAEPLIETNKRLQSDLDVKVSGIKANWWHIASIPATLITRWLREDGIDVFKRDDWPKVKRKLMDPEWKYLRTGTGRL